MDIPPGFIFSDLGVPLKFAICHITSGIRHKQIQEATLIRRFGKPPVQGVKYDVRHGSYAILPKTGHLLLTFQKYPEPELQLPGGGIDPGESPLGALHREVYEETGWRIGNPRRLGAFRRFAFMPEYDLWAEKICAVYVATPVRGLGQPPEKDHSAIWVKPEVAAKTLANPGDAHFVRKLFRLA